MKKLINFFKALGVVVIVGIAMGAIYIGSILGALVLVVLILYVGITEYHRSPDKNKSPDNRATQKER